MQFVLLYLRSDSTTVPLAATKLRGPRDAFKKGFQKISFVSFLKKDNIMKNTAKTKSGFSCDLFITHQGREVSLNRATRGRIVSKAKRIIYSLQHNNNSKYRTTSFRALPSISTSS